MLLWFTEGFTELNPIIQALLATIFTWAMTALGASAVFFFKVVNRKFLDGMLGFAAGVMIAASFWSLLAPAIEMVENDGGIPWIPAVIGFLSGGLFLWIIDKILPHLHLGFPIEKQKVFIRTGGEASCLFWQSPCTIFLKVWLLVLHSVQ
jgi:ZIP family zinc transporter